MFAGCSDNLLRPQSGCKVWHESAPSTIPRDTARHHHCYSDEKFVNGCLLSTPSFARSLADARRNGVANESVAWLNEGIQLLQIANLLLARLFLMRKKERKIDVFWQ